VQVHSKLNKITVDPDKFPAINICKFEFIIKFVLEK